MGPTPQSMLPPQAVASMVRGGDDPNSLFQQNPLASNMTPGAMGVDPTLMQQPPVGSQAMNPTMPPSGPAPMPPVAPDGQSSAPQLSEAEMILQALSDRLAHHSKITEKTIAAITSQLDANQQVAGQPTQ